MSLRTSIWLGLSLSAFTSTALAEGNFNSFDGDQAVAQKAADPWSPPPAEKISLVDVAPALLAFFNNGPVFGVPGTVTGDLWERTQLTGDWNGARTRLAHDGVFIDAYLTSYYQDVTSGGVASHDAFIQSAQFALNIDTGRAGLWPGGVFHFGAHGRWGRSPANSFTAGTFLPQYGGLLFPGPTLSNDIYPTEYYYAQAFSKKFSIVVGKINNIVIPDQTMMGDSFKYYFANFAFNKNPMTANFYEPTAWAALAAWVPEKWLAIAGGVLDPHSESQNFADNAFDDVNLYLMAIVSYKIDGLPGQFAPAFNWSNKAKLDLTDPFGPLAPAEVPEAIGGLLGLAPLEDLPGNYRDESWFLIANFSQYLYVTDPADEIGAKMRSGQVLNGIGVFGRLGYAPDETNKVAFDASIAVFAHGLIPGRPYDSFGVGFYYNGFSDHYKDAFSNLTGGAIQVDDESGVEVFYDFALTPAIRIIPSYQHIWNPTVAAVAFGENNADVFTLRLNLAL